MIEHIEEYYFEKFDNSEGDDRIHTMDRLIVQYASKIREIINAVNMLSEKTGVKI